MNPEPPVRKTIRICNGQELVLKIGSRSLQLAVDEVGNIGIAEKESGCWLPPIEDDKITKSDKYGTMPIMENHLNLSDQGTGAEHVRGLDVEDELPMGNALMMLQFFYNLALVDVRAPGLLVIKTKNKHASLRALREKTGLGRDRLSEVANKIEGYDRKLKRVIAGQHINRSTAQRQRWKKTKELAS